MTNVPESNARKMESIFGFDFWNTFHGPYVYVC